MFRNPQRNEPTVLADRRVQSPTMPVLIAEDDAEFGSLLAERLTIAGFTPATARTATAAAAMVTAPDAHFCALILDVGLPDGDGRDLCVQLRRNGVTAPILMLSGANSEQDVVRGLDAGANDYIRKPFRSAELIARLHTHIRLFENSEAATFVIGPYVFRPAAKLLQDLASKRRIRLTNRETGILKFLYRAAERQVTRSELLREVWGYNAVVETHTLETHIYRLRQKMEADPANPRLLLTSSHGYSLAIGQAGGSYQAAA